jgi:hypothetical protein
MCFISCEVAKIFSTAKNFKLCLLLTDLLDCSGPFAFEILHAPLFLCTHLRWLPKAIPDLFVRRSLFAENRVPCSQMSAFPKGILKRKRNTRAALRLGQKNDTSVFFPKLHEFEDPNSIKSESMTRRTGIGGFLLL